MTQERVPATQAERSGATGMDQPVSNTEIGGTETERAITSGDPLTRGHLRSLDGLRGVALLLVLFHHLNYTFPLNTMLPSGRVRHQMEFVILNGWLGVDVFFVLSGFLITTILLKSREATNFYGAFYMRRLLRLAPLYYIVIAIAFFGSWPNRVVPSNAAFGTQLWWWLNASNLRTAFEPHMLSTVSLFWSLAVEEQFYLVWPTVVRWVSRRTLLVVGIAGVMVEMVVRVLPSMLQVTHTYPEAIYRLTPLHCDGLLLGAALSVAMAQGMLTERALPWLRAVAGAGSVLSVVLLRLGFRFYTTPAVAVTTSAVLCWLVLRNGNGLLSRVLDWAPLRLTGRYSYCMYVTQTLVLVWAGEHLSRWWRPTPGWPLFLYSYGTVVAASFAVGALSWKTLEGPVNGLKRYFPYRFGTFVQES